MSALSSVGKPRRDPILDEARTWLKERKHAEAIEMCKEYLQQRFVSFSILEPVIYYYN